MTPNAVTLIDFNTEQDRLRADYLSAQTTMSSWAFAITEALLRGEDKAWIDSALSIYSQAKDAEELAFQEFANSFPPPVASDSPQQQ